MSGERIRRPKKDQRNKRLSEEWFESLKKDLPKIYDLAVAGESEKVLLWMTASFDEASSDLGLADRLAEEFDVKILQTSDQIALLVCCRKYVSLETYQKIYQKILPQVLGNHSAEKSSALLSGLHPSQIKR